MVTQQIRVEQDILDTIEQRIGKEGSWTDKMRRLLGCDTNVTSTCDTLVTPLSNLEIDYGKIDAMLERGVVEVKRNKLDYVELSGMIESLMDKWGKK